MQQAVYHQYPNADVEYSFFCRNQNKKLGYLASKLQAEIYHLDNIKLSIAEANYLKGIDFMKDSYVDYLLNSFKFNSLNVVVKNIDGDLSVKIAGKWVDTILYEVFVLSIVNQLYYESFGLKENFTGYANLSKKLDLIRDYPNFKFAEFGTRRRFSKQWQEEVLNICLEKNPNNLVGTSNVSLAFKYNLKPIGTVAHEWFMAHLSLVDNIRQAQKRALHVWQQEYGHRLGTALTDTFTTEVFFKDFNFYLARAYDGVRHDSGDPYKFGEMMINKYQSLDIDPKRKSIIFSDGLDFPLALDLWKHFVSRINVAFGIGTNLTNDLGYDTLSIVMKLTKCNGVDTFKISDNTGKVLGNNEQINNFLNLYN